MERTPTSPPADVSRPALPRRIATRIFSDGSLTKKGSLNSLAATLDFGALAIVGLVVNPILLTRLGDAGFGTWQFLQRLIGHANPAGARPSEALKWFVANRQSSHDLDNKRRAVGSAVAVAFLFTPLLAMIGATLGWFAPVWLNAPRASYATIRLASVILVADLVLTGFANVPWAVLQGENLGYKRLGLTTALVFIGGGLTIAAAVSGMGLVGISAAEVATTVLTGAVYIRIARRFVPWFGIARPDLRAVWNFIRLSWWFLLWNVVTKVMMGGDIVVLGLVGSTREITIYSLTRYVPLLITGVVTVVIYGIMPGLGGLVGAGDRTRGARVRSETMTFAWFIATLAGAGVLLWERSFLLLWVGPAYYPGLGTMLLIVVLVLQFTLIRVDSNIIDLTLNLRTKVLLGLVSVGLSVIFAWLLMSKAGLGIAGLVAGFIAGRAVISVAYPVIVARIFRLTARSQIIGMLRPAMACGVLFAAAASLGQHVHVSSWLPLLAGASLSALVLAPLTFFGGLSPRQRALVRRRARQVVRLR